MATRSDSWDHSRPLFYRFALTCDMAFSVDYHELDEALRRAGSHWASAQAHGLLCGRLAIQGAAGADNWRDQVLESLDPADALRAECELMLDELFQATWRQLADRQSEFELLLPDDSDDAEHRTRALAEWCEGFLHGLVADARSDAVRKRLAEEPLADLIRDMLEITRATVGDEDEDTNENAYAELVEYIRVAVQLTYEELADLRTTPLTAERAGGSPETLH